MPKPDDLSRDAYCFLGLPLDAIEMRGVLRRIRAAADCKTPFLVSTINVNFVATAQVNVEFWRSILISDLCPVDGMPIVWLARALGVPIKGRVAGSDIFEALKKERETLRPLKVFLFGGDEGVATTAAAVLNEKPSGLCCVGAVYPGFGNIEEMSRPELIDQINASQADLIVVALGAAKGQTWLLQNHDRLRVPVRIHLGAVINFTAGKIQRAPVIWRKLGLEWLWRIKEEPSLWRRYAHDGGVLLRLFVTRVLPLALAAQWQRLRALKPQELQINEAHHNTATDLKFVRRCYRSLRAPSYLLLSPEYRWRKVTND